MHFPWDPVPVDAFQPAADLRSHGKGTRACVPTQFQGALAFAKYAIVSFGNNLTPLGKASALSLSIKLLGKKAPFRQAPPSRAWCGNVVAAEGRTPVSVRRSGPPQGFVSRDVLDFPRTPLGFSKLEGDAAGLRGTIFLSPRICQEAIPRTI